MRYQQGHDHDFSLEHLACTSLTAQTKIGAFSASQDSESSRILNAEPVWARACRRTCDVASAEADDGPHVQGVLNLVENLEEDGGRLMLSLDLQQTRATCWNLQRGTQLVPGGFC